MAVSVKGSQNLVKSSTLTKQNSTIYTSSIEEPSILLYSNDVEGDAYDIMQKSLDTGGAIGNSGSLDIGNSSSSSSVQLCNTYTGTPVKLIRIGKNSANNVTNLSSYTTNITGTSLALGSVTSTISGSTLQVTSTSSTIAGQSLNVTSTTSTIGGTTSNIQPTTLNINSGTCNVYSPEITIGSYLQTSSITLVNDSQSQLLLGTDSVKLLSADNITVSSAQDTCIYGNDSGVDSTGALAGLEIKSGAAQLLNKASYSSTSYVTSSVTCNNSDSNSLVISAIKNTTGTPSTTSYIALNRNDTATGIGIEVSSKNDVNIESSGSDVNIGSKTGLNITSNTSDITTRSYGNTILVGANTTVANSGKRSYSVIGNVTSAAFTGISPFDGIGMVIRLTDANNIVIADAGMVKANTGNPAPDGKFYSKLGFYSNSGIAPFTGVHIYEVSDSQDITVGDLLVLNSDKKCLVSTLPIAKNACGIAVSIRNNLVEVAAVGDTECGDCKGFKVTNENGPVLAGDLLVSSSTPGYLMKQQDDIIRSYTVGKAMQDVSFDLEGKATEVYGYIYCG